MWVPRYGPIAQCFTYIGTIIPRYTKINYHFLIFEKKYAKINWVQIYVQITRIPFYIITGHYNLPPLKEFRLGIQISHRAQTWKLKSYQTSHLNYSLIENHVDRKSVV